MKSFMYTLFIMTFCFFNASYATILNVPDDHEDINSALQAADNGDTVLVQPGTYIENIVFPDRSITLASLFLTTGNPEYIETTVIDGDSAAAVVGFSELGESRPTFSGFTVTNGSCGISVYRSSAILTDLIVNGNISGYRGGGLSVYIADSLFIRNCVFSNNFAESYGGGISIWRGNIALDNVEVFQNESGGGGGICIWELGSNVEITNSRIYENTAAYGGGLYMVCGSCATLRNVEIFDNEAEIGGGIIIGGWSEIDMQYSLIRNNTATERGSGLALSGERGKRFTNVTVTQNVSDEIEAIFIDERSPSYFTNCIIFDNGETNIRCIDNCRTIISHCDLEGGRDAILTDGDPTIEWLDGNIDTAPLFTGIDCNSYYLSPDSPCINTGDPDSPRDADSSLADMGCFPNLTFCNIYGRIRDAESNRVLENVNIEISDDYFTSSNEIGGYVLRTVPGIYDIRFSVAGYNEMLVSDFEINRADSLELNIRLLHPEFHSSENELIVSLEQKSSAGEQISIINDANGRLEWSVEFRATGEEGARPWEIRREFAVGEILENNFLYGAVYNGENYFLSGRGEDVNMIYVVNPEGELVNQFPQPGESNRGILDMTWDGELIWGTVDREVYGFNTNGDVIFSWSGPITPITNIAWDSENELLWMSGTVTHIFGCNRNGEPQIRINREDQRIRGLAFYQDDIDGYPLYVLHDNPEMDCSSISKVNPETGEFIFIRDFIESDGLDLQGMFITQEYDQYGGWVMMTISSLIAPDGGDRLEIFQLEPNLFFVEVNPLQGVINAGESDVLNISFETVDESGVVLGFGIHGGNLLFTHNAMGGQSTIPIQLIVLDPDNVETGAETLPDEYEISSIYPNPFNSFASIDFSLPEASIVNMSLYDLSGRLVRTLAHGQYKAGNHDLAFDGSTLVSGLYLVKLQAGNRISSRKVMLLK